jgi:hypothetical protein
MTTLRSVVVSLVQFVGHALRPGRRVTGIAQELGISFLGAAGVIAIWRTHGGLWALLTVVALLALLFLVDGWQREYQRIAVKFSVTENQEEPVGDLNHDPDAYMSYSVIVRNEGAVGHFNAAVVSDVRGATNPPGYGHFEVSWQGTGEVEPQILPGRTKFVVVGAFNPTRNCFQFKVPPSPHTEGRYGWGNEQVFKTPNWQLEFELEVRYVETGEHERRTVRVRRDPVGAQCPVMKFV